MFKSGEFKVKAVYPCTGQGNEIYYKEIDAKVSEMEILSKK